MTPKIFSVLKADDLKVYLNKKDCLTNVIMQNTNGNGGPDPTTQRGTVARVKLFWLRL